MEYICKMKGTCASEVKFELNDGKISAIEFKGGCNGNLKAIAKLCEGKDAAEVAGILIGNTCGYKNTSCADQLARGIISALEDEVKNG